MGSELSPVLTSAGYLLIKAGVQVSARFDEVLGDHGLTGRDFLVLTFAGGDEPLSQQDLSRRLGLDPTIVVALVDGLEAQGLLKRTRNTADRRRYNLSLTAAGRKVAQKATREAAEAEAAFLDALSPADRARLQELLYRALRPGLPWLP